MVVTFCVGFYSLITALHLVLKSFCDDYLSSHDSPSREVIKILVKCWFDNQKQHHVFDDIYYSGLYPAL